MKILQISQKVPYPLNEGGNICIYNTIKGFADAGHEVTFIALNGIKHQVNLEEANQALNPLARVYIFNLNTNVNPLSAFLNLFTKKSYNIIRFYHKPLIRFLGDLLRDETFDIIHLESSFSAIYVDTIRQHSQAPIVLRQHNIEYQIWKRLASNETNFLKRWYLNVLAKRLKSFEEIYFNKFDAIVAITAEDKQLSVEMGCHKPIFVSPAGIDTNYWEAGIGDDETENPFHIYHLGSLEWLPNREAVLWFINDIWPLVHALDSRFQLFIAGKNTPDFIMNLNGNHVSIIGEIKEGNEFVKDKAITVVPLKSGGGIRLKILEAMAAKKLVISTTIGAQGIEYIKNQHLLIADTPEEFAHRFAAIAENPKQFEHIKQNGYDLIHSKYSVNAVISELLAYYQTLIKNSAKD